MLTHTLRALIVDGTLTNGQFLPTESELMLQFGAGRNTVRESLRLLENDGLIELRRGSRSGARVCIPGAESMARPARFLLQLAGATIDDVITARASVEPAAAKLLADNGNPSDIDELQTLLDTAIPAAFAADRLPEATAVFHRRLVELTGNTTLALIAAMLHEITEHHLAGTPKPTPTRSDYRRLVASFQSLIELLRTGDGDRAQAHWRAHLNTLGAGLRHRAGHRR